MLMKFCQLQVFEVSGRKCGSKFTHLTIKLLAALGGPAGSGERQSKIFKEKEDSTEENTQTANCGEKTTGEKKERHRKN
jgi:hypothetical protein